MNRLIVHRRPLLIFVSSTSLLPILMPAHDVRRVPNRFVDIVANRLGRLGVPASVINAETGVMSPVVVGPTIDRSVVGVMVDFAKGVPYYLDAGPLDCSSLELVEERLAETPCHSGTAADRVAFPDQKALELLTAKWAG